MSSSRRSFFYAVGFATVLFFSGYAIAKENVMSEVSQTNVVQVVMETNKGSITIELDAAKAPQTVENFLRYVDKKFYDETIFHRVIDGFMIQGGGFTADMRQKPTDAPVKKEAGNRVPNKRGTIAMARTMVVDSATCQFFINLKDNGFLNHQSPTPQGFGYCVFGHVVEGMDVVDEIAKVKTGAFGMHRDVPSDPVLIRSIRRK